MKGNNELHLNEATIIEALQEYLVKGKQVLVMGRLQTRQYEKDGEKRYSTEVKADRVTLLGGGNGARRQLVDPTTDPANEAPREGAFDPISDSDIPF